MNILFSSAGRRTYLLKYFRENMQEGDRIVAVDMDATAPALQAADVHLLVPAADSDGYVDRLLAICREQQVRTLFSAFPHNSRACLMVINNKTFFFLLKPPLRLQQINRSHIDTVFPHVCTPYGCQYQQKRRGFLVTLLSNLLS